METNAAMKAKKLIIIWLIIVVTFLCVIGLSVAYVDPYFHYHKPLTDKYYYQLNHQRAMNNGIVKNFDYDAIITGTSLTENFKTSELDELFGVNAVKVPFQGGSLKELNDNLSVALRHNGNIKMIVRGIDFGQLLYDKDRMREDLGDYPTYLYDDNLFNDVEYWYNKEVLFSRVAAMALDRRDGVKPGIPTFDDYSEWGSTKEYGAGVVLKDGYTVKDMPHQEGMSEEEKRTVHDNVTQNITSLAEQYKDVDFCYFIPPYSIVQWDVYMAEGSARKRIEAEKYAIELILEHDNIHFYSFNTCTDITTNLDNYYEMKHYGPKINSYILQSIRDNNHLLTKDNYGEYIDEELEFYLNYDYSSLSNV